MTIILSRLTENQAVTVLNVFIAIIQYSLPLLLVIMLVYFMPNTNTALAWNSISQMLHSSLWPILLRTDSGRSTGSGTVVKAIVILFRFSMILLPISAVLLPLGLGNGPIQPSSSIQLSAKYVPDTSALKLMTSPNRNLFRHGYTCHPIDAGCDTSNITAAIPPSLNDIFDSTPHGPFSIQYRRFLNVDGQGASMGYPGSAETFILRNESFVAEGLVIDMTSAHPGLGFINHTIPTATEGYSHIDNGVKNGGGTWSQEVIFLEPVTSCVDTNLTLEYTLTTGVDNAIPGVRNYSITDHGGFANLPDAPLNSYYTYDGNFDLQKHAHNGAVVAAGIIMQFLNISRATARVNDTYPVAYSLNADPFPIYLGRVTPFPFEVLPLQNSSSADTWREFLLVVCGGYGGGDLLDISRVHVTCGMFLGAPLRTDGGENDVNEPGSSWSQSLHSCASTTRASIQNFTFSIGSFEDSNTANLNATRDLDRPTVLWAMEKRNETILESLPLWGRIDEQFLEKDLSQLWTMRNDHFLLPATSATFRNEQLPEGSPQNAHAAIWLWTNAPLLIPNVAPSLTDYSGRTNYAMKTKFQDIIMKSSPGAGAETVLKLIWTDMLANQLVGTPKSDTLTVSLNLHTLSYDFRFAILGYLLGLIWLPVFLLACVLLSLRKLGWNYLKHVFNHLYIGRVVTKTSALKIRRKLGSDPSQLNEQPQIKADENGHWAKGVGRTQVKMVFAQKGPQSETMGLMPMRSFVDDN